jgi:hypothetical protein
MAVSYKDKYGGPSKAKPTGAPASPTLLGVQPGRRSFGDTPSGVPQRTSDDYGNSVFWMGGGYPSNESRQSWVNTAGGLGLSPQQAGQFYASIDPETAPQWATQYQSDARAVAQKRDDEMGAANALDSAVASGVATQQDAIRRYTSSPTQRYLTEYADPEFKAISDDWVNKQRVAAGRAITKEQADAIAAGVNVAGGRGYDSGGAIPASRMAAGFRGAGDRAAISADLATAQETTNLGFRQWATGELSNRDSVVAGMRDRLASLQGANPLTSQANAIRAGAAVFMPDLTQPGNRYEKERFLKSLGMSEEESAAALQSAIDYFESMSQNAASAEERERATENLHIVGAIVNWLGEFILPGNLLGLIS